MSVDDRLREELGALLDGELPPEREAELRARIEREPELARELEALRRTVDAVRGLGRDTAPGALRERLAASIAKPAAPPRAARVLWPRWWLASAAVLLVAVGAALLAQLGDEPRRSPGDYEATLPEEKPARVAADDDLKEQIRRLDEGPARLEVNEEEKRESLFGGEKGGGRATPAPAPEVERADAEALDRGEGSRATEPEPDDDGTAAEQPAGKADHVRRRDTPDTDKDEEGARRAVLSVLARDGRLAPDRRREYLAAVAALAPARIRSHVAGLPEIRVQPTAPSSPAKGPAPEDGVKKAKTADAAESLGAKSAAPPPLTVRMADRTEAAALAGLIRAGFPKPKAAARAAARSLEVSRAGVIDLLVWLTAREKEQVRNWLALIDATRAPDKPAAIIQRRAAPGADTGGDAGARAAREPVRVRILFAK